MRLKTILITLSVILIAAIPFVTKAYDDKGPGSVRVIRNLAYCQPANDSQSLDLYLPTKSNGPTPLIIFIHGGAWVQGDKGEAREISLLLAQYGFATASINYRFSQQALFPAQIEDCRAAVRWLRSHAQEYGIDPDRFGVWGVSAGGHLASLLGTSGDTIKDENLKVQAVCDWCGPSDLVTVASQAGSRNKLDLVTEKGPVGRLLGGPTRQKEALAKEASPVTYINSGDPPFLIVHGDIDDLVPFAQAEEFCDKLKAAGVAVEFVRVRGAGHNLFSEEQVRRLIDFFKQELPEKKNKNQASYLEKRITPAWLSMV